MKLIEIFKQNAYSSAAFVGAGGKTTALFELARQIVGPVFVTTTTKISVDEKELGDRWIEINSIDDLNSIDFSEMDGITVFTGPQLDEIHMGGLSLEIVGTLQKKAIDVGAVLLMEADGSKKKSLKAPLKHEPVIPEFVDIVVVSAGMDVIGKKLDDENVHRADRFSELCKMKVGQAIDLDSILEVLTHKDGGLKGIPSKAVKLLHLTHINKYEKIDEVKSKSRKILKKYSAIILSDLKKESKVEVESVFQKTTGIILAAGGASRAGSPKQLFDWFGEPVIRKVVKTALSSDLTGIIVVTGKEHEGISDVLADLNVKIVNNQEWQSGISSSISVGLDAIPGDVGAAMFILADQPQIPSKLINKILEDFECNLSLITHPLVDERIGNPVLFNRSTFTELKRLEGDRGGKRLFSVFDNRGVLWDDERILYDIDTEEDYFKLTSMFKDD